MGQAFMLPFEPDGVYANVPYRVLPDCSIEAMMPGGLVKFKNMDHFTASAIGAAAAAATHSTTSYDVLGHTNERNSNVPAPAKPLDYYSILLEAIEKTEKNSAQLRALVYERARFNFKRDVLFGHSSLGLADLVQHIKEFELAVVRIEANAVDEQTSPVYRENERERIENSVEFNAAESPSSSACREQAEGPDTARPSSKNAVQIMPPRPVPPLYARFGSVQRLEDFQYDRRPEELRRYKRFANQIIGILVLGIVFIGAVIVAGMLWYSSTVSRRIEAANLPAKTGETAAIKSTASEATAPQAPKLPYPLPASYGIYALNDNKLTELQPLPIHVPDPRVALSAELKTPSTITISDHKPAFILFRRDLLNNAPQKLTLRVIARMARETKIVGGKAMMTKIEGAWRIRNISREYRVSPVPGHREMIIARPANNESLAAGRYALVLNRVGYDFTVKGPVQSPEFCLEGFETINGSIFTQCRAP
jgi:hypothetical protein